MTRVLETAIAKLEALPPEEQDRLGNWLLDELSDEEGWAKRFATSQDLLAELANEARAESEAGTITDLDPSEL